MKHKVLVFFPQALYPPQSGFHKRGQEIIEGFCTLGCDVTLASLRGMSPYTNWDDAGLGYLKSVGVQTVHLYQPTSWDRRYIHYLTRFNQRLRREPPCDSSLHTPPGMRRWFRRLASDAAPDLLFMNYAYYDGLISHRKFRRVCRVMDTIDLLTLNQGMWQALSARLPSPPIRASAVDEAILDEAFYEKLGLRPHPREYRIYDQYDHTIAITRQEADLIRQHTSRTQVVHIPMTHEPRPLDNRHDGAALLTTGPNPYNTQAYLYFVRRVLPRVRQQVPSFRLDVTGYCCDQVVAEDGMTHRGFVPDLAAVYESARFLVCPLIGGTGQPVKIVEAMAHGVPVIALRGPAERSPIRHGDNGMIAAHAEEFAEHVVHLWNDPALCRRLGQAARETIAKEFPRRRVVEALEELLT